MKTVFKTMALLLALGVFSGAATGCVSQRKVMFKQEIVQGRSVRHIRNPVTQEYSLQVCEYDQAGKSESCKESTILVEKETESLL